MWALDPMLRGPGASARVILVLNQKRNGSDMFWDAQAVKSISNLNLVPRLHFEVCLTACHYSKQKMIELFSAWRTAGSRAALPPQHKMRNSHAGRVSGTG
jgi:hypothetical protein